MCRIPKVVIVASEDKTAELRRALSSIEYDIITTTDGADVAVMWEPDEATVQKMRDAGLKTVAIGGATPDLNVVDPAEFKTRIWELFRPS